MKSFFPDSIPVTPIAGQNHICNSSDDADSCAGFLRRKVRHTFIKAITIMVTSWKNLR